MKPPFHYEGVKWRKVKQSLTAIGMTVDSSLQAKLERLAQRYHESPQRRGPTAQQFIDATVNDIKKIAAVRDLFAIPCDENGFYVSFVPYLLGDKRAATVCQMLTAVETELRNDLQRVNHGSEVDTLRYEGRQHNASKPALRNYLFQLAVLWNKLAVKPTAPRYRNRFVHACAEPVAHVTIKNVRDYLSGKKTKTTI